MGLRDLAPGPDGLARVRTPLVDRYRELVAAGAAELKVALVRAALRGIAAIRDACPGARIVNLDPLCGVVPASDDPAAVEAARRFGEEAVFQLWDMVSGRIMPERLHELSAMAEGLLDDGVPLGERSARDAGGAQDGAATARATPLTRRAAAATPPCGSDP
jgi:hypothetical protein